MEMMISILHLRLPKTPLTVGRRYNYFSSAVALILNGDAGDDRIEADQNAKLTIDGGAGDDFVTADG